MREGVRNYTERRLRLILHTARIESILAICCSLVFAYLACMSGSIGCVVFSIWYFALGALGVSTTKTGADVNYPVYTDTEARLVALKVNLFLIILFVVLLILDYVL